MRIHDEDLDHRQQPIPLIDKHRSHLLARPDHLVKMSVINIVVFMILRHHKINKR